MEVSIKWKMCRTCTADNSSQLQPLFTENKLAKQLLEYTGIVMKPDDGLPEQICEECVQHLETVHTFLSGCKEVDEHLRNVLRRTLSSKRRFPTVSDNDNLAKSKTEQNVLNLRHKAYIGKITVADPEKTHEEDVNSNAEDKIEVVEPNELESLTDTTEQKQEDYLVVVSKCVLNNLGKNVAADNEYIITDVGAEIDDDYDDDNDDTVTEQDTYAAEVEIKSKSNVKKVGPAATIAPPTIVLAAACEPTSFPRHSCAVCGNSFPNHGQLKSHMRSHRNEKIFECEMCSKSFNAACNLTTHMRTHTGEKPFSCCHCGRRFADRSTQRKHERMHTNERPYSCEICGKNFSLSTTLKAHSLSHSKVKPHKCLTCNKGFKLPHQLKAHERTHVHRYEVSTLLYNQVEDDYSSS